MGKKLETKKCPRFNGASTNGNNFSNKDFIGKKLVIYFGVLSLPGLLA